MIDFVLRWSLYFICAGAIGYAGLVAVCGALWVFEKYFKGQKNG